ncbi:MAG: hypothetical protein OHK0032_13950 [Thermodesulfovibrionales bacterium]
MPEIEERVESLEALLGRYILHTDITLNRLGKEIDRLSKEVDRVSKNVDKLTEDLVAYREEARQERIEMNKSWGEIANKMGTLVEDMVAPNIKGIAKKYFGCEDFEDFMIRRKRRHSKDKNRRKEFDIIAVCDESVIVNETKSTPRLNYIDDFTAVLDEFFDFFPEYKGKRLIPIFASLYLSDDVIKYLTDRNIYAMAIKEDTMDLLNYEDIRN